MLMNLTQKLERSRDTERIDFSKYQSTDKNDPLVKIETTDKILVEPCWTIPGDFEGNMYSDYIADYPEYDGVYVRFEVLSRLTKAAMTLPDNLQLVVRAGHRPIEVQKRLLKECAADYARDNPDASEVDVLEHARTFVSDPDITLPPHVCGAAVDVEVINTETGELLDFGSKMNDDTEQSFLHYPHLTDEQKSNRQMLLRVMLDAGFASCMPEWWHFSYGDQVWAWFYGEEQSLYSPIDLSTKGIIKL